MKQYDEIMNDLQEKFRDCPGTPESLSKENIVKKIKEQNVPQEKKKSFSFKAEAMAAALALIIVGAIAVTQSGFVEKQPDVAHTDAETQAETQVETVLPEGIQTFKTEKEIEQYFRKLYNEKTEYVNINGNILSYGTGAVDGIVTTAAANSIGALKGEISGDMHGETNVQTVGVDEGDIIKNDGRYIYVVSNYGAVWTKIKIVDSETMTLAATIEVKNEEKVRIDEIYVSDNILSVVYSTVGYGGYPYLAPKTGNGKTTVEIYDIGNKNAPKKIAAVSQDGSFNSSRKIGNVLYTVSTYYVSGKDEEEAIKNATPTVNGAKIGCDCIYYYGDDSTVYTVLSALDVTDTKNTSSVALIGGTDDVYCSEKALYLLDGYYKDGEQKTKITSFALNGTKFECKATGEIKGTFDDKYSFDEYNGYLRAATGYYDNTAYKEVNKVYVLDEKLNVVGESENLNDEENIKAVRFMGEKGYVVTFRQTDPLYSLDLSDPKNPKILGELKLPGYSTYLHPLGENLLMGIGYDGDEENAKTENLKIALFDISDMTAVSVLDEFVIKNSYSDANYEPKALIHYPQKNIVGIPVTRYSEGTSEVNSFAVIRYTDNSLSEVRGFVHASDIYSTMFRGTYIGDMIYTIDDYKVIEHSLSTGENLRECTITTKEERNVEFTTAVPAENGYDFTAMPVAD